jgi:hypothetical protein
MAQAAGLLLSATDRKSADAVTIKTIFDFVSCMNEPEQSMRDVAAGTPFDTFLSSHLATTTRS